MGLTPLEARSVGVPVIATRDGGLPEAAGPSALLCKPASVPDLKRCLLEAAAMSEAEYQERAGNRIGVVARVSDAHALLRRGLPSPRK